jgi:thiol:disulfide interchange protein
LIFRLHVSWLLALAGVLSAGPASAADKHVEFTVSVAPLDPFTAENQAGAKKAEYQRGRLLLLTIKGKPGEGWYTYPVNNLAPGQDEGQRGKITLGKGFVPVGPVRESEPKVAQAELGTYHKFDGPFTWEQEVLIRPDLPGGKVADLEVNLDLLVCTVSGQCVPEKYRLSVPVPISAEEPAPLSEELKKLVEQQDTKAGKDKPKPKEDVPAPTGEFDWRELTVVDHPDAVGLSGKAQGLMAVLLGALAAGFISLATPCVFPMIPVTVSVFLKQGETERGSVLARAGVYCLTLVVVLTIGGIALGSVLQSVSQHWATNLFLTFVFVFFGLSLLGAYDVTLPSWLSDATSSGENRGGLMGVVFMALTFSIISFACVGPIYGGFTALSATSASAVEGWTQRILAPLAFALAFTAPFFVLALFPSLLKKMPRSGSWMNVVKVTMGFVELAAAFKFVRAAEIDLLKKPEYFTFDLILGIYVALAVAAGLYLLGLYRLPHDHDPVETIGVMRLVVCLVFLSLAAYLLPGIFKDDKGHSQKPRGVVYDWTRSFLLPDDPSTWSQDLARAMAQAERDNKPLFIDFTAPG